LSAVSFLVTHLGCRVNYNYLNGHISAHERFWARVKKSKSCWLWQGGVGSRGYASIMVNSKNIGAHRYSWFLHNGPIATGIYVLHKCDVKLCVNPKHLFLGTAADNATDCKTKGRTTSGDKNAAAKLRWPQVREIRRLFALGTKSQLAIAQRFGISQPTVSQIIRYDTWGQ